MVPPADPKKLKDMKHNQQVIQELDELGILNDLSDYIFANPNASIPSIQRYAAEKYSYPDIGSATIDFIRHGYTRPQVGNGRMAYKGRRKKVYKSIPELLDDEFPGGNNDGNL